MYCPSCGESIPDNSKFCLHCGKPATSSSKPLFSDMSPQHIAEVGWKRDVPTEKNWLGKVSTGFSFWFQLLDNSLKPTRSDGKLSIRMSEKHWHTIGPDTYTTVYQTTIQIQDDDFDTYSKGDRDWFGFRHNVQEAVLKEDESYWIEIWFETPDRRKLYGTDRR